MHLVKRNKSILDNTLQFQYSIQFQLTVRFAVIIRTVVLLCSQNDCSLTVHSQSVTDSGTPPTLNAVQISSKHTSTIARTKQVCLCACFLFITYRQCLYNFDIYGGCWLKIQENKIDKTELKAISFLHFPPRLVSVESVSLVVLPFMFFSHFPIPCFLFRI